MLVAQQRVLVQIQGSLLYFTTYHNKYTNIHCMGNPLICPYLMICRSNTEYHTFVNEQAEEVSEYKC